MSLTPEKIESLKKLAKSTNALVSKSSIEKLKAEGLNADGEKLKVAEKKTTPKALKAEKPSLKKKEPEKVVEQPKVKTPRNPTKEDIDECKKLLATQKENLKRTSNWKKKRAKKGLPEKKTAAEVIDTASEKIAATTHVKLEKGEGLSKKELSSLRSQLKNLVKTITAGITAKTERKSFIQELIAELRKQL